MEFAFEVVVRSSPYNDKNTCLWQSMCYQPVLRFQIW